MTAREGRDQPANTHSSRGSDVWEMSREDFERDADAAERMYAPIIAKQPPAKVIGLHRAVQKRLDQLTAELKAFTDAQMRERGPGSGIGSREFKDMRRGR